VGDGYRRWKLVMIRCGIVYFKIIVNMVLLVSLKVLLICCFYKVRL
jgi:hypothetical protein